jgi:hypothetical protein
MPMRSRSFRTRDDEWERILEAAGARGVTPSAFVREAAVARAIYEQGMRHADPGKTMLDIIKRLRE